jgi:MoxR-like ATPase
MTPFDAIFDPDPKKIPGSRVEFPPSLRAQQELPENYRASADLLQAAKVAVLLRKPLLITGEAGTGKTQLAHHLHWRLRFPGKVLVFETKSTSKSTDLFYTYNTLGRFHAAYTKEGSQESRDYIRFNALGEAILRTLTPVDAAKWLRYKLDPPHTEPQPSVVLIDEVDKAPSDFPNDILNEIEHYYFRIPELNNDRVELLKRDLAPVIVLTSNSEKTLPAPCLRRCVYLHIEFPTETELRNIVAARITQFPNREAFYRLLNEALDIFKKVLALELTHKPATAEFLDWLLVLLRDYLPGDSLKAPDRAEILRESLSTLKKGEGDQSKIRTRVDQWLNE